MVANNNCSQAEETRGNGYQYMMVICLRPRESIQGHKSISFTA